jgi:hypothetical protein
MVGTVAAFYNRAVFLWGAANTAQFSNNDLFPTTSAISPNSYT